MRYKTESISKDAEVLTYGYDGKLVTSETLSGTLNQTLGYSYNNDFDLADFTYAGDTTNYTYDNDGLLTGAGEFTIFRNTLNGLPEAVIGGSLSLARSFNGYGEIDEQNYIVNSSNISSWDLIRNNNGKITAKTETVNGLTSNYVYTCDPMGRFLTGVKNGSLVIEYVHDPLAEGLPKRLTVLLLKNTSGRD